MNCHIDWQPGTDTYNVWLYRAPGLSGSAQIFRMVGPDEWRFDELPVGSELGEPTFRLHSEMLKAFAREASKLPLADDATAAHLKDAREVRDRLLRIVEHKAGVSA